MGHSATHLDRVCFLEVKGQRYIEPCRPPLGETALLEVIVLAGFQMIWVTGPPVCCTSRRGSTAATATTAAADSYEEPSR